MFRLHFRKVVDEGGTASEANMPQRQIPLPAYSTPIQFSMTDEHIWKDDRKFIEKVLSGSTEMSDFELVQELVSPNLGPRLLRL